MILRTDSKYPIHRTYVVKLGSDASPDLLRGRLENLISGTHREFSSAQELFSLLGADLTQELETAKSAETAVPNSQIDEVPEG